MEIKWRSVLVLLPAIGTGLGLITAIHSGMQQLVFRPLCQQYIRANALPNLDGLDFQGFNSTIRPATFECTMTWRDSGQPVTFRLQRGDAARTLLMILSAIEVAFYAVVYGLLFAGALHYASR